ncbi:NmrA-like family [Verrucomicrobiia bacterium DG1235]|nr:NmrA-like family [Verrucomicrobiae bacterium DG1235]
MKTNTHTPSTQSKKTVLVIGANGKTGRRVVQRLRDANYPVKAASRSSETTFDWSDQSTWAPALQGTQAAYVTYYPDLAFPGAADKIEAFAKIAVSLNVKRLVLLSGRGEEGARDAEIRLEQSGAEWTILRCAFFNQNFSEALSEAIKHGVFSMPVKNAAEPFLDADDIAEIAFEALTKDRHIGQLYELTGPKLLSLEQVAQELSDAIGREVKFQAISQSDYATELNQHGFPIEEANAIAELFVEVLDGRNAYVTNGVQRALGRKPRDFAEYARQAAATGIWNLETALS